jgi:predicted small integral membrane protein
VWDRGWRLIALECVVSNVCVCGGGGLLKARQVWGEVYRGCEGDWEGLS